MMDLREILINSFLIEGISKPYQKWKGKITKVEEILAMGIEEMKEIEWIWMELNVFLRLRWEFNENLMIWMRKDKK